MTKSTFVVPAELSFEQAIELSQTLLSQIEQSHLAEDEIEQAIAALVSNETGARGFFVTYLTGEQSLADQPSPPVIRALQSSPTIVADLLVKNLAMSTAMAITHRRNQNPGLAAGSERVRTRTHRLMQAINFPLLQARAESLLQSVVSGQGEYHGFLNRWGYDAEQHQAIQQAVQQVLERY